MSLLGQDPTLKARPRSRWVQFHLAASKICKSAACLYSARPLITPTIREPFMCAIPLVAASTAGSVADDRGRRAHQEAGYKISRSWSRRSAVAVRGPSALARDCTRQTGAAPWIREHGGLAPFQYPTLESRICQLTIALLQIRAGLASCFQTPVLAGSRTFAQTTPAAIRNTSTSGNTKHHTLRYVTVISMAPIRPLKGTALTWVAVRQTT